MALLSKHNADIELENLAHRTSYGSDGSKSGMPRLDLCHNCGKIQALHVEGKCVFDASTFKPVDQDFATFKTEFMQWASGQKLEDALCHIVYELTRRDR